MPRGTFVVTVAAMVGPMVAAAQNPPSQQQNVPIRQVAAPTAVTSEPLGLLLGVRPLADGRVIVNDGQRRRLLMFDASLARATVIADSAGSTGLRYGPNASPIVAHLGDSTLFLDRAAQAFIVLDAQGRQARLAALPKNQDLLWIGGSRASIDPAGRLVYRGAPKGNPTRDTGQTVMINRLPESAPVVRASFETRTIDTAGHVKLPLLQENHRARQPDGSARVTVVLFGLSWVDDWTMTSDGAIAILRGQDYHIDWIAVDGTRTSTAKIPFDWRALSDEDQMRLADSAAKETQAFIDRTAAAPPPMRPDGTPGLRIAARADLATGAIQVMPIDARAVAAPLDRIPDFDPPFRAGSVLADLDTRVWILPSVSTRALKGGLVYDVVDRQGTLVERVELPSGRSVAGFSAGGVLYMMHKDPSDVWRLERTRVVR
jgi:hypothetical protein